MKKINFLALLILSCTFLFKPAYSQESPAYSSPPMGWNSWDCFFFGVTESEIKATADYMAENLLDFGWEYLVLDMGWYFKPTVTSNDGGMHNPPQSIDEWGRLIPDSTKFPSSINNNGLKPLADYVHSKGLKFGLHMMRGVPWKAVSENFAIKNSSYHAAEIKDSNNNCKWSTAMIGIAKSSPGMQDYYNSVFELYASWGVDYIKVDDVAREFHDKDILAIEKAIENCGRPMFLSLSPGPAPLAKATFFQQHANAYRISNDFWDDWSFVLEQFQFCNNWSQFIIPGYWPDADMLPFGKLRITGADNWVASLLKDTPANTVNELSRFTNDEMKTVFTLWSIFKSPLMYGGYFPESDDFSISLLKNEEVLAVNQGGLKPKQIYKSSTAAAWVADVPDEHAK